MKFAEHLAAHVTPEWHSQYIRYDEMKDLLYAAVEKAQPFIDDTDNTMRENYFLRIDEFFFQHCEKEASKINTFFAEKLAEALRRLETLKTELRLMTHHEYHRRYAHRNNIGIDEEGGLSPSGTVIDGHQRGTMVPLTRVLPERFIAHTIEKRQQRTQFRKIHDVKLAFSEFYLMLVLLQNYQTLNFTGFRKILKKHDKLFQTTRGEEWRKLHIDYTPFYTTKRVDQLINEVETMYTDELELGNRPKAMKRLRVPPLEEKQSPAVTFRVGMLCLLIPIVIALGVIFHENHSKKPIVWRQALLLYRSTFLVILHIILVGFNVYGWSSSGVNHVLIFEIDPRNHLTYQQFLEVGTFLFVLWFLSFISFILTSYFDFHPFIQPVGFLILLILFLINPTPTLYHQARFWFLRTLGRVLLAPWYKVGFADFWLGDQLTSLELLFFDLEYFICFYVFDINWWSVSNEPTIKRGIFCSNRTQIIFQTILLLLPSWFRFSQCLRRYRDTKQKFPHLLNAGKYASGFFVVSANSLRRATLLDYEQTPIKNPFFYFWIIASVIGSSYKLVWDLKMDWGFFDKNAAENKLLRDQCVYPSKIYYYIAICEDILFRYLWVINIFLHFKTRLAEYADVIGFIFGLIEIFRRFIWNYFRLENEHLNNCGQFRAVRDISITPIINSTDYSTLEDMMDKKDGVKNRKKSKRHELISNKKTIKKYKQQQSITTTDNNIMNDDQMQTKTDTLMELFNTDAILSSLQLNSNIEQDIGDKNE
ncbi:unnamed protein product [Didymodactylos carnosus]|uniref:Xenotropic and polytropic retrovirus receptor 1 n=1 Tax=Didymodactylos carnosus TaxID=1234261 RepID=A0A814KBV3_9BILA|nr:unnamed protein product [Didymodactylos carnosus]CAF3818972.1 unnamed protein product [Didymodactylos carnosus]